MYATPNLSEMARAQTITGVIEQLIEPVGAMPSFHTKLYFEQKEQVADFVAVEVTHVAEIAAKGSGHEP